RYSGRLVEKLRYAEKRDVSRPRSEGQAACCECEMSIPRVRVIVVGADVQKRAGVGSIPGRDVGAKQDITGDLRGAHIETEVLRGRAAVGWRGKCLSVCGSVRVAKRLPPVIVSCKIIVDSVSQG